MFLEQLEDQSLPLKLYDSLKILNSSILSFLILTSVLKEIILDYFVGTSAVSLLAGWHVGFHLFDLTVRAEIT